MGGEVGGGLKDDSIHEVRNGNAVIYFKSRGEVFSWEEG